MYIAALYTGGKVVTGCNHGEAFGKLSECEQNGQLCSGFIDPQKLKFFSDECEFYLKQITMLRHGDSVGHWNSPITKLGRSQAKLAAAFIVSMKVDGYLGFCSPMLRCVETAHVLEEVCNIHFTPNPKLMKQGDKESCETFLERVKGVLDDLPAKSLIISHCDFIQVMTELASDAAAPEVVPNCSITHIENHRAIWVARSYDGNSNKETDGH